MMKRVLCLVLVAMGFTFAQDVYIRNICDTLPNYETLKTELKLAYVDETLWYGDKDLSKADSVKNIRHQDYSTLEPIYVKHAYRIPYSITAICRETTKNLYAYGEWDQTSKSWSLNNQDSNYVTQILDINMNKLDGYDSSNSYNILLFKKGYSLEGLTTENMMVSRTFEFNFGSWFAIAKYKMSVKLNDTTEMIRSFSSFVTRMDSAKAVADVVKDLNVPDEVSKVEIQIFHSVLNDSRKTQAESSSSAASSSSSGKTSSADTLSSSSYSGAGPWNCGDNPLLSCSSTYYGSSSSTSKENSSSSYVQTSSSEQESSSSVEQSTIIGRLGVAPRVFNGQREVRRLDGTKVKAGESLVPGIYYVKGLDGRWKKQIEF